MVAGKKVQLFLVDGTPGGLMTGEIMGWTGQILKGRREHLKRIVERNQAQRPGIYILLGSSDDGAPLAYIGQSDDVSKRLKQHDAKKDFWDEVVLVTSTDMNLTSAHVRFLESRLISRASALSRTPLANGNEPSGGATLPEADEAYMGAYIENILILLPVMGVELLRGRDTSASQDALGTPPVAATQDVGPVFFLKTSKGVNATAQLIDGEFTVLTGSVVSAEMRSSDAWSESTRRQREGRVPLHANLVAGGTELESSGLISTTHDEVFASPSAAASVVQGIPTSNGRTAWVTSDGLTFEAWQQNASNTY